MQHGVAAPEYSDYISIAYINFVLLPSEFLKQERSVGLKRKCKKNRRREEVQPEKEANGETAASKLLIIRQLIDRDFFFPE